MRKGHLNICAAVLAGVGHALISSCWSLALASKEVKDGCLRAMTVGENALEQFLEG